MEVSKMVEVAQAMEQRRTLEKIQKDMKDQQLSISQAANIDIERMETLLSEFSEEQMKELTYAQAKEMFVDEEGKFIFDEELPQEMVLDFIKHFHLSQTTFEKVEAELVKYDEAMTEYKEEMEAIYHEAGSYNKKLRTAIEAEVNNPQLSETKRNNAAQMLAGIDDAISLKPLFDLYSKISTDNTLNDFRRYTRYTEVLEGYVKACKAANMQPHLLKLGDIQKRILDEKYHADENLFVFIVARYIKYNQNELKKDIRTRAFVVQLIGYVREMLLPEGDEHLIDDKAELDQIKENIAKLLDMFLG